MPAESFLDRYSLPRIARLMAQNRVVVDDQHQHQYEHQQATRSGKKVSTVNQFVQQQQQPSETISSDDTKSPDNNNIEGELFLLYRHLKKYRVYHAVNAKSGSNNRKKGIKIPQDFTGKQ
jgi:hypothetical protein